MSLKRERFMGTADTARDAEGQKEIVCPCGTLLVRTSSVNAKGLKTCPGCERMIHFDVADGGVRVRIEDREALSLRPVPGEGAWELDEDAGAVPS